jgi:hypothetical protein
LGICNAGRSGLSPEGNGRQSKMSGGMTEASLFWFIPTMPTTATRAHINQSNKKLHLYTRSLLSVTKGCFFKTQRPRAGSNLAAGFRCIPYQNVLTVPLQQSPGSYVAGEHRYCVPRHLQPSKVHSAEDTHRPVRLRTCPLILDVGADDYSLHVSCMYCRRLISNNGC